MRDVAETLVELYDRLRRRPRSHWLARIGMLACGMLAQLWISLVAGPSLWNAVAVVAIAVAVFLPRTIMPLLTAALIVVESAATELSALALAPVAGLLLGWHLCATLLSLGMPWSRMGRGVVRGFGAPVLAGVAGLVAAAVAAWLATGITLPEAGIVTLLVVLSLVLGGIIVLWPNEPER